MKDNEDAEKEILNKRKELGLPERREKRCKDMKTIINIHITRILQHWML